MAFSPLATNVGSTGFPGFAVDGPVVQPVSGAKLVDTFGTQVASQLSAPLRVGGELIGVLGISSVDATRTWSDARSP